jgi:nucleoside-diphosphate-sugar epimerase
VKRVVLTSSIAAVINPFRDPNEPYTYTSEDWNPLTYEDALSANDTLAAYRASKKLAELEAWNWARSSSSVNANGEKIDLTVFCPPLVFGPWAHPVENLSSINASNQVIKDMVLGITKDSIAAARISAWIDVRDLALAHVEAAYIRPETSNKRFIACGPEESNYQLVAQIIKKEFPARAEKVALPPGGPPPSHIVFDGSPLTKEVGIRYTTLRACIVAVVKKIQDEAIKEGLLAL